MSDINEQRVRIQELLDGPWDGIISAAAKSGDPTPALLDRLLSEQPDIDRAVLREVVFERLVADVKAAHKGIDMQRISVSGMPDDLLLVREVAWNEYESILEAKESDGTSNAVGIRENLENFLLFPIPRIAWIGELRGGRVVRISREIDAVLGFADVVTRKNV